MCRGATFEGVNAEELTVKGSPNGAPPPILHDINVATQTASERECSQAPHMDVAAVVDTASTPATVPYPTEYVKIVGLPYQSSNIQIKQFLHGIRLCPNAKTVYRVRNDRGGDTGRALVRTESVDEARRAAELLHLQYMEWRYVEVYQIGEREARKSNLPLNSDRFQHGYFSPEAINFHRLFRQYIYFAGMQPQWVPYEFELSASGGDEVDVAETPRSNGSDSDDLSRCPTDPDHYVHNPYAL